MKKRIIYTLLLGILGLNLLLGAQIYIGQAQAAARDDVYANMEVFTRVLELVRQNYVDGGKVSYEDLVNGALKGMINTLDPHSEFMDARKFDDLRKDTSGEFGGVGIVISLRDNVITVVAPMDESPSAKAGIAAGDRIVKIDGQGTEKITVNDAVSKLRGKPGSKVTISIMRASFQKPKDLVLERAIIKVSSVRDLNGRGEYPLGADKTGYIRISSFGEHTDEDLEKALQKLEVQGMLSLVLDLRDNPGGLLDQAVRVSEKFLPKGQLVVSTEGRTALERSQHKAAAANHRRIPMAILVNEGSASASEIVAGCLQDLKRAVLIGEKTFGKGSVQSILPLKDGAALRLTTAKYYTPSHREIHGKGILPDTVVPMSPELERDVALKRTTDGIESLDEKDRERVRNARDVQLDRAIEVLKALSGKVAGK